MRNKFIALLLVVPLLVVLSGAGIVIKKDMGQTIVKLIPERSIAVGDFSIFPVGGNIHEVLGEASPDGDNSYIEATGATTNIASLFLTTFLPGDSRAPIDSILKEVRIKITGKNIGGSSTLESWISIPGFTTNRESVTFTSGSYEEKTITLTEFNDGTAIDPLNFVNTSTPYSEGSDNRLVFDNVSGTTRITNAHVEFDLVDGQRFYMRPNGDVNTDFTPSTGTDNYATVDEKTLDTNDYNSFTTESFGGEYDEYTLEDYTGGGTIVGVKVVYHGYPISGNPIPSESGIVVNGTFYSAFSSLGTPSQANELPHVVTFLTNPDTSVAWQASDLNDVNLRYDAWVFGVQNFRLFQAYLVVFYEAEGGLGDLQTFRKKELTE